MRKIVFFAVVLHASVLCKLNLKNSIYFIFVYHDDIKLAATNLQRFRITYLQINIYIKTSRSSRIWTMLPSLDF